MNMGDVAQKAAVSLLMVTMVNAVEAAGPYTQAQATSQLFALINNQANTISGITISDPFANMKSSGTPAWLVHIFDSAGAPYPG